MMRLLLVPALFVLATCGSNMSELANGQGCVVGSLFTHILQLERKVAIMSTELKSMSSNQESTKSALLANITRSLAAQATVVAFSVSLQSDISQIHTKPLSFDAVVYNQGNAYNKATGMFTAPVSGTYIFWANVMVKSTDYLNVIISKGSTEIGRGYTFGKAFSVASITTTTYLDQGDQVWMHVLVPSSTIPLRGGNYSSYGGALIHAH